MNAKLAQLIHEYRERYHDLSLKTCYVLAVRDLKDSGLPQLPSALWALAVKDMLRHGYHPMTQRKVRK